MLDKLSFVDAPPIPPKEKSFFAETRFTYREALGRLGHVFCLRNSQVWSDSIVKTAEIDRL